MHFGTCSAAPRSNESKDSAWLAAHVRLQFFRAVLPRPPVHSGSAVPPTRRLCVRAVIGRKNPDANPGGCARRIPLVDVHGILAASNLVPPTRDRAEDGAH